MAFKQLTTSATQTAVNAAATVAAGVAVNSESQEDVLETFDAVLARAKSELLAAVEADNATLEAERENDPAPAKSSGGGSNRGRKTGGRKSGGSKGGGRSGGKVTLDDALTMVLKNGAFEGETLGTVVELSASQCEDDYGYGDGERSGEDYIAWLASDDYNNDFVQRRARLIADDRGIEY